MIHIQTIEDMRSAVKKARMEGKSVGLVPTLGYLHEGHASLIARARSECDFVIVSVFVNPLQFGPKEDFSRYPRDLQRDTTLASNAGADALFVPDTAVMYPQQPLIRVTVASMAETLCGASRPGHFDGVVTVVSKLFHISTPDRAYFGEKDMQQLMIIQRMATDLNMPVEVVACPTIREKDGLAKSSRNVYLSPEERAQAPCIYQALSEAQAMVARGERSAATILRTVASIIDVQDLAVIDYVSIVDPATLQPVETITQDAYLAVAVRFGSTRLIDNIRLEPKSEER